MDPLKTIGENIQRRIRELGYASIELFAHEHGLHQSVLSRLLGGKRGLNLRTFIKIAEALEVSLNDLYPPVVQKGEKITQKSESYQAAKSARSSKRKLIVDLSEVDRVELKRNKNDAHPLVLEIRKPKSGTQA